MRYEGSTRRVIDFTLYLLIGMIVALGIIWGASYYEKTGSEIIGRWGGWAAATAIVFGFTIQHHKMYFHRVLFWLVMSAFVLAHVLLFLPLLRAVGQWKLAWWIFIAPVEYLVLGSSLMLIGFGTIARDHKHRTFR